MRIMQVMRPAPARCLVAIILLVAAAPFAAAAEEQVWEHWYTLEIAGSTAGWMHEAVWSDGDTYRTAHEMKFKLSRGPVELEVTTTSEFVETRDGAPVRVRFVQDMAMQPIDTEWIFEKDHVRTVSKQGGRTIDGRLELPEEVWLTPMSARRFSDARREAGADTITYRTVDPSSGIEPVTLTFERLGEDTVEFEGRTLPVTVWRSSSSALPPGMSSTSSISADGHLLHDEAVMPFGKMVTRVATKAGAMAVAAEPAPELMVTSFVTVAAPIERPRQATTAKLRLRTREGDMPELPSAGAQRARPGDDARTAVLEVDVDDRVPAPSGDREDARYLEASAMLDTGDELIRKLAGHAVRDVEPDRYARAESMRRFVHEHISAKGLDTAFATASETARLKTGDCSEHGVLLCAMLRAEGIPARVATGLLYADSFAGERDIFGWHMWTQALIDGEWVDFDATLETRYDAAHILTGTSSLSEGLGARDMMAVLQLMGNLEVEVLDVGYE